MLQVQNGINRRDLEGRFDIPLNGRYLLVTDSGHVDYMPDDRQATYPLFSNSEQDSDLTTYIVEIRGYVVLDEGCSYKLLHTDDYARFDAKRLQDEGVEAANTGS